MIGSPETWSTAVISKLVLFDSCERMGEIECGEQFRAEFSSCFALGE